MDSFHRNSWRIRALSWYLMIAHRSHNNKNDHLTRGQECPRLNAWVSRYHYPRSSNKYLLLWKISSADNQGLLCWLTYETEFTYMQIITSKLSIWITIHDATKSQIISLTKNKDLFYQIFSFLWIGHNKNSEARQIIKLWPIRTKPGLGHLVTHLIWPRPSWLTDPLLGDLLTHCYLSLL